MKTPILLPKLRKGKGADSKGFGAFLHKQELKTVTTPIISKGIESRGPKYKLKLLDRNCLRQKAVSIRNSVRWIDAFNTPNGGMFVPFIDQLGRFTGHSVYKWSCDPRSLIATTISTICDRLKKYALRHNKYYVVRRYLPILLRAATYYAFTKNSYFWDRILYFTRQLEGRSSSISRTTLFFLSKLDVNKRFVYSQVCFQTNWLLFRAQVPRDKSIFFKRGKGLDNVKTFPTRLDTTNCVRDLAYAMSLI